MKPLIVLLITALFVAACSSAPAPTPAPTALPGLPNPASANCIKQGGNLDIRTDASGGQIGVCVFPDGSECEEWAFYRNECQPKTSPNAATVPVVTAPPPAATEPPAPTLSAPTASAPTVQAPTVSTPTPQPGVANMANPASVNCVAIGGTVDIRTDASGGQVGYCKFPDGTECEEWALFRGECRPGGAPTSVPQAQPMRIVFPAGGVSALEQGTLGGSQSYSYVVRALAGQTMSVNLRAMQGQALIIIWGADGSVLISDHAEATSWSGVLPSTQDYYIDVRSAPDMFTTYRLEVTIPPLTSQPPEPQAKSIIFQPGSDSALVEDSVGAYQLARYTVRALGGQTMSVNLTAVQGQAILIIWGTDGNVLISDHAGATSWSGVLPSTQDYIIDVRSVTNTATDFWLQVVIPPL